MLFLFLQCYSHLTEWGDLEKAALVNVDDSPIPKLERVWEDSYYHVSYVQKLRHYASQYIPSLVFCIAAKNLNMNYKS